VPPSPKVQAWVAIVPGATSLLVLAKVQLGPSQLWVKPAVGGVATGAGAMVMSLVLVWLKP